MMKVVITGSNGMLGKFLVNFLREKGEFELYPFSKKDLDITDFERCFKLFKDFSPHVLINCAAYARVDGAERERELALKVNSKGVKNLALLSDEFKFYLIHISTNYVFDGRIKKFYSEKDPTDPINFYGYTKLLGEENIRKFLEEYTILRVLWLYGNNPKSFPSKVLEMAKSNDTIKAVDDVFGTPSSVESVSRAIYFLMRNRETGILHYSPLGFCSYYEYALILKRIFKFTAKVIPISIEELKLPAQRPKFALLDVTRFRNSKFKLDHFEEELKYFYLNM